MSAPTGVRSFAQLTQRCAELGNDFIIDGLIPARSLGLIVGASGLGKSPLAYQMAICVAGGRPFIGFNVHQQKVLVLDYENGVRQVHDLCTRISGHLGIDVPSDTLRLWNGNDAPEHESGRPALSKVIVTEKPGLVIIDSLAGFEPQCEEGNREAAKVLGDLRRVAAESRTSILLLHHPRKTSDGYHPPPLEQGSVREWFNQVRGPSVLVNGTDVRLGVEAGVRDGLVIAGFARVNGEISPISVKRVFHNDGEPMGYDRLRGLDLLRDEQRASFLQLPSPFSFTQAQYALGKGAQATADFLRQLVSGGLAAQPERRGPYFKTGA